VAIWERIRGAFRPRAAGAQANEDPSQRWVEAAAAKDQWFAFADWVGIWTVDDTGRVYFAENVDLSDQIVVDDPRERNMGLFRAALRHPELAHLRPVRQPGDNECPHCDGTGRPRYYGRTYENVWCSCGGVGWLPAGYVDPHTDTAT
jgi:hypothetical protein